MNLDDILKKPIIECACDKCISACKYRPCWGTIEDMENIIDKGFSASLMLEHCLVLEHWSPYKEDGEIENVFLLVPALRGYEGRRAPFYPIGTCTFLNKEDRCIIHKIKPTLGKVMSHNDIGSELGEHKIVAKSWYCEEGINLIERWKELVNFNDVDKIENNFREIDWFSDLKVY